MKFRHWLPAALLSVGLAATAAENAPFAVTNDSNLKVSWHGKPLVVGEYFTWLDNEGFAKAENRVETVGDHKVFNRFGEHKAIAYRREAALKNGGREVEISFQFNVPAYTEGADNQGKGYELCFRYADFAGWKYTAVVDRVSKAKTVSGILDPNAPDGNVIKNNIRQIALESPDGQRQLVIDCSPEGVNDFYSDYPPNGIQSLWGLQREGDILKVVMGYRPRFYGGSQTGKVQLYEGSAADYDQRHAQRQYSYFSELKPDRQYVFGAKKFGKMYTDIGVKAFDDALHAGWLKPDALNIIHYRPSGALYSAVASSRDNTFQMKNLRSGVHLLTFALPAFENGVGPMSIAVNGQVLAKDLKLKPRTVTLVTAPVWIENGVAEVALSGRWQLATVNDQLLQASAEDFSFRRGFWVSGQGPHPSVMFQSEHYAELPRFNVGISDYPLPEPGKETAAPRKALQYPASHAQFAPGADWCGGAMLGSWGTSNNGSFAEFAAPGAVERRVQELKDEKIDAVIVNGLLSRHTYPKHVQRIEETLARIVKAAHPSDIKIMDHWDFSLLWNCDSGFRVLTERMDQLQQTIDCGLPARGLCPTNPTTRKVFFDEALRYIQATGIDGLMVDEACFHGVNFCGCAACRKQFTADTGWMLPADETSAELQNKLSPLWRAWQAWRMKTIGDFWVAFRDEVKKFKSDFVFIGYTTHYGMYSYYAPLNLGSAMEQLCRAWDFVGTEIMSRNIFASFRSVACFRKMKNMYRNVYNIPVFGLVYSDALNWDILYFGWALNNLNAQTTWEMSGVRCPDGKPNYRMFDAAAGNPDKRTVRSKAEIAILFSNLGRDCERSASSHNDGMGFSQILTANHVPHEFIFEEGLTPEVLGKYKVLIVANATAMSEAHVQTIRKFVENGGIAYFSSYAGFYNEIAMKRDHWLVGRELLNQSDYGARDYGSAFLAVRDPKTGREMKMPGKSYYQPYQLSPALETVLALVTNAQGHTVPGLVRNKIGRGLVYFSPVAFGASSAAFEVTSGQPMNFERNPEAEAIALEVIRRVAENHFVWTTRNVPDQVITSLYETADGKLAAHFLNATQSNYKKGEKVPSVPPPDAFAPLPFEMGFQVRHPGTKAYAVSPEWAGRRELLLKRHGELAEVTIPAKTLGMYMIVYVE